MPPKGPGSLRRLLAHDNALYPSFGRAARRAGVGDDVLDVKDNQAVVVTPADAIPEVDLAHKRAWKAFDRQDFDGAVEGFLEARRIAANHGEVAYKSENTLALVYASMADFDAALQQTSRLKSLLQNAPDTIRARFRPALHTNRGVVYTRMATRETDERRRKRLFELSYAEHCLAASIMLRSTGRLDTERVWNVADLACRLGRFDETAAHLSAYWARDARLAKLLEIHSQTGEWPRFLARYQEADGRFVPSRKSDEP